jgi:hypothetical protein
VRNGKVYLTGPYNGGPFGLTIVVPTSAGPYTLTGNGGRGREIVRAAIRLNPVTEQASVVSDPLPSIIEGIPLDIKTVNVTITRPNFIINPTDCEPTKFNASFQSTSAAAATASAPFRVTGCTSLPFKPRLTATATAQGSKVNGTSVDIKIETPGLGQANIHAVNMTIPAILPSRLGTIQKACPAATFEANPADCDEGSVIGEGIVRTPILKSPLRGPAYLVSHAAEAFPDVEFVLQGEGVTAILDGKTDIKHKITYTRFDTAPDEPFTSFEARLPAGPHSALTINVPEDEIYNLCHQHRITIPTELVAQSGASHTQATTVELTGCAHTIKVLHHKYNARTHVFTMTVYVPAAGTIKITGKGIRTAIKDAVSREPITVKLRGKGAERIHISYAPAADPKRKQTASVKM